MMSARIELDHTPDAPRIDVPPYLTVKTRERVSHDVSVSCGSAGPPVSWPNEIRAEIMRYQDGPFDGEFRGKMRFCHRLCLHLSLRGDRRCQRHRRSDRQPARCAGGERFGKHRWTCHDCREGWPTGGVGTPGRVAGSITLTATATGLSPANVTRTSQMVPDLSPLPPTDLDAEGCCCRRVPVTTKSSALPITAR
jgi:hypothetical protein